MAAWDHLSRSWLFEIVDSKTEVIQKSFTLVLPPQSYQIKERGRVSIVKTFGNAFVDDYGPDNLEITISGISGTAHAFPTFRTTGPGMYESKFAAPSGVAGIVNPAEGYTGRSAFYTFRDTIMRYRDKENYDKMELRVYDLYDEQSYKCVLLDFTVDRTSEKPFHYPFTISLFVYARLDSKAASAPTKIDISGDPFTFLDRIDGYMEWFDTVTRAVTAVQKEIGKVTNAVGAVRARLNSSLTTARTILEYPLNLSKQLIETVVSFGGVIREQYTAGRIGTMSYINFLEVWKETLNSSLRVYGFSIQAGAQQEQQEVIPVDGGVDVSEAGASADVSTEETSGKERLATEATYTFSAVKMYTVHRSDSLQTIAQQELGDENLWPYIASVNSDIAGNGDLVVGDQIYIPVSADDLTKDSFIMTEDRLRDPYGADIRLDSNGDIVFQENNDVSLINGIGNIQQAIDLRLNTVAGSMLKQTAFGLAAQPGQPGTEMAYSYLRMALKSALIQDPRIEDITNIIVNVDGDQVGVSMNISVIGYEDILPVSELF